MPAVWQLAWQWEPRGGSEATVSSLQHVDIAEQWLFSIIKFRSGTSIGCFFSVLQHQIRYKENIFRMSMVRHWNRLLREPVDDSYQEINKLMLDEALGNLIYWKLSLLFTGPDDLQRSFPTQTIIWFYLLVQDPYNCILIDIYVQRLLI